MKCQINYLTFHVLSIILFLMKLIARPIDRIRILKLLDTFPVTAILGARQCGKTTIARNINHDHYFDLENPIDMAQISCG